MHGRRSLSSAIDLPTAHPVLEQVHAVYESILDWDLFSIRIREKELENLPRVRLWVGFKRKHTCGRTYRG